MENWLQEQPTVAVEGNEEGLIGMTSVFTGLGPEWMQGCAVCVRVWQEMMANSEGVTRWDLTQRQFVNVAETEETRS